MSEQTKTPHTTPETSPTDTDTPLAPDNAASINPDTLAIEQSHGLADQSVHSTKTQERERRRLPGIVKLGVPVALGGAAAGIIGVKAAASSSPESDTRTVATAPAAASPTAETSATPSLRPTDLPTVTASPEAKANRVEPRLGMTDAELDAAFAMYVGPDATAEQIVKLFNQRELDLFHFGLRLPDTAAYDWKKTEAGETRTDNIIQKVMAQDDVLYDALFDARAFAGNSIRQEQDAARNTFAQAVVTDISYERVVNGGTLPARYKPIHKEVTVSDIQEVWRKKVKEGTLVGIRWKARSEIDYTEYPLKVIGRTKAGLPIDDTRTDTGGLVVLIGHDGRMYVVALGPESL